MAALNDLIEFVHELLSLSALAELAALAACLALAGLLVRWLRSRQTADAGDNGLWLGQRGTDGLLFPLAALAAALLARALLRGHLPVAVFALAVPLLAGLAVIRTVARVLHVAFPASAMVGAMERSVSWGVWAVMVLWITGLLSPLLDAMDEVHWKVGGTPMTLRTLTEGVLSTVAVLLVVLWLSASLESRLMRASTFNLSARKMAANLTRAALLLVGLLVALSAAGIPLGALGVLGGAVGVGLGLGLQKLAANYVSGFVILAERSLRIGDMVRVDGFEGRITDITTRYTLIRAPNGRESIVPNELMIGQRVENCSFSDPRVATITTLLVPYGTDLDSLTPPLLAAMLAVPRVVADPAPAVQLSAFAADGLELTCVFWILDMHNGQGNVRSDVNLAILRVLKAAGVEIPFPQRMVQVVGGVPPARVDVAPTAPAGAAPAADAGAAQAASA